MDSGSSTNRGWMVACAGLGINLALGVLYTWSVVSTTLTTKLKLDASGLPEKVAATGKYLNVLKDGSTKEVAVSAAVIAEKAYNWSAQQGALPYMFALGVFALMMVFAGRAQDKFGPRIVATIGGVLVGAGMLTASFSNMTVDGNHILLIIGFGVLTGAGIGLGYASATPAAVKWFHPSRKGLITGIVVGGFGAASVYTAPLTKALIASYGVSGMFRILGIGFFLAICVLAQLLQDPPSDYVPDVPDKIRNAQNTGTAAAKAKVDYTWQEMVRMPAFYMTWLMYALVSFAGLMMIGIVSKVAPIQLGDPDFGLKFGYTLTVALAIGNGIGRPIAGWISDKIGRNMSMVIVFLSQALFVGFLLSKATTLPMLLVVAAFIGFNYGSNLALFPSMTGDYFGTKNLGVNYGLVFTAWGVGGIIGSQAAAWIFDKYQSYNPAFLIAAALCMAAAAMTFVAKPPKTAQV